MFSFLIGSTVWIQIYKKNGSRVRGGHANRLPGTGLRADYPKISIFTSLRMSVDGTSTTGHLSCPSNAGFTVRPLTFTRRNSPGGGSWSR